MLDMQDSSNVCKKCPACNQLVVVSDTNQGLLNNNQVIKMIKHLHSHGPFPQGSVEAKDSQAANNYNVVGNHLVMN